MQKCGGQILFTSKSVGKTWRFKTPAKMCCTFLGKSAGEAGRVFLALAFIMPSKLLQIVRQRKNFTSLTSILRSLFSIHCVLRLVF